MCIQKYCIIDNIWKLYTHTYKPHQNTHPSQHVSVNMLYILQNACTTGRRASFLILLMMGAWRPKHVEWLCKNIRDFVPNTVMWWPTCNYNTCTRTRRASLLILLKMGAWRPKHVEWPCRNKTCTVFHQVGVYIWPILRCAETQN